MLRGGAPVGQLSIWVEGLRRGRRRRGYRSRDCRLLLQWELALRDSNETRAVASSSKLGITLRRRNISRTSFTLPRALRSFRLAPRFRRETKARTMVLMLELSI